METTTVKTVDKMSTKELEAHLAERRKLDIAAEKAERKNYERVVNKGTSKVFNGALKESKSLYEFLLDSTKTLEEIHEMLNRYGKIRSNSKGGFLRITDDGNGKIVWRTSTICDWDERSVKAEELLKDFLGDVVKKKDKDSFELILALIEKNKEGKLELSRIQTLYAKEKLFDDPRWVEALRLFKESFRPIKTKMRLEVYKRSELSQKWEPVILNISSF